MNIATSVLNDPSTNYIMRLNKDEILISQEDPLLASQAKEKQTQHEKEKEQEKIQEAKKSANPDELSEDEKRLVKDLQARDQEVKTHEAAHQAAGGGMTGAASYTYQQGPDGKMYAIGGEVSISTPHASTPQEAIKNARQVATAAMAASNPSSQDFAVAASARAMEIKAQQELARQEQEKTDAITSYEASQNYTQTDEQNHSSLDFSA